MVFVILLSDASHKLALLMRLEDQHDIVFVPGSSMAFGKFNVVIVRHGLSMQPGPVLNVRGI